jgi:hypothetical protein
MNNFDAAEYRNEQPNITDGVLPLPVMMTLQVLAAKPENQFVVERVQSTPATSRHERKELLLLINFELRFPKSWRDGTTPSSPAAGSAMESFAHRRVARAVGGRVQRFVGQRVWKPRQAGRKK